MLAATALPAAAQQTTTTAQPTTQEESRGRVVTTIDGDAGLWWIPVADTNGKKKTRGSLERNSRNNGQGLMNISNFTANFSIGLTDRFDLFGAYDFITRVDRDNQVLFVPADTERGGIDTFVPYVRERWTGNKTGDFRIGGKYAFLSEGEGDSFSAAGKATLAVPAGDADEGGGQGGVGLDLTGVLSRWITNKFVVTGSAGYNWRKNPEEPVTVHVPNHLHWGGGIGINPTPSWLIHSEVFGNVFQRDNAAIDGPLVAEDGSISPPVSRVRKEVAWTGGLTWMSDRGFFIGAEVRLDTPMPERINASESSRSDYLDYQVRLGWVPRRFVPPPPAPTPPPPTPPAPRVHDLSVKAACDPCTVEVGKVSTVTATATSSISCVVTYAWSAPTGTFADRTQQKTQWTAPMQEGPVPVTVTVTCPSDQKTASDTVTIQVIRPAAKVYTFEDVHFDFDRYTLRPEALRILEQAVSAMKEDANLRLTLEGHTCNIGTAEYNLALGERRAMAVREYLSQNGVAATRLQTVSFGEEKPKHDNSREETRRLNRRAALVVRLDK
ncbi:MAG TPA: OmpA family protein [Vicinamibacterales bacterium]|nr:OmpA family protein [Vicinamibacterales bacterium]